LSDPKDPPETNNKALALLIAILALLLAFSELGGTNADNEAIESNVEASNLWSFFQAKTIRRSNTLIAVQDMQMRAAAATDPAQKEAMEKLIADWRGQIARYDSDPEPNDGRKELAIRAKAAEDNRKIQKAKGDIYDVSSAMLQIGIVLASATIITGMMALAWIAMGLGVFGTVLMLFGLLAPLALAGLF
jgi:hypothetical protein